MNQNKIKNIIDHMTTQIVPQCTVLSPNDLLHAGKLIFAFKNAAKQVGKDPTKIVFQWKDIHEGGTHPQCDPMNGHTYFQRGGDAPIM